MIRISEAEFEIMQIIWDKNPISTNEIVDIASVQKNWNMRTIHTLISRLKKKGALTYKKEGKVYIYSPLIAKEDYINSENKSFVQRFYNGAFSKMVMSFIDNNIASEEDIKTLKKILEEREKQ